MVNETKVGVSGTYKVMDSIQVGVGGAWKTVSEVYVGVGGAWKQCYANVTVPSSILLTGGSASDSFEYGGSGNASFLMSIASGRIAPVGGSTPYTNAGGYTFAWEYQSGTGLTNSSTTGESFNLTIAGSNTATGTEVWKLRMSNAAGNVLSNSASITCNLTEYDFQCFDFSSLIWKRNTATNTDELIQIGLLEVGDTVRSWETPSMLDEEVEDWMLWSDTDISDGSHTYSTVTRKEDRSVSTYFRINDEENVTGRHPFLISRSGTWQWIRVQDLIVGDLMLAEDDSTISITSVELNTAPLMVTLLGVETVDTYFAGQFNGKAVLTHNK